MRVDFKNLIVSDTAKIVDALKVIDGGRLQAALVLDEAGRLRGIVTDGDVRRGLLRGVDLNSSIGTIMNDHPIVISEVENRETALRRLRELGMRHLPVVNGDRKLVALELVQFGDLEFGAPEVALLMAGGLGKRLRPITETIPKPMVQVGASPILEIIIRNLAQQGISRFYVSVNYKAEMIEDYFGDGAKWGVQIFYLREGEQMGTAGALSLFPERPQTPFLVMNGDIITSVNLKQMYDYHRDMNAAATVGAFAHEYQVPYGVLKMDDSRVVGIDEKPVIRKYVSAGIYILAPGVLEFVRGAEALDMPTLIERVVAGNMRVAAFPIREYWIDIGQHGDLQRASRDVASVFPDK